MFGRNPMLAAAVSHPKQGFPEVERGWPKKYKLDVCARLEELGVILLLFQGQACTPLTQVQSFDI